MAWGWWHGWESAGDGMRVESVSTLLAAGDDTAWVLADPQRRTHPSMSWQPYFGDRTQDFAVLVHGDHGQALAARLRTAPLSRAELAAGRAWRRWFDPSELLASTRPRSFVCTRAGTPCSGRGLDLDVAPTGVVAVPGPTGSGTITRSGAAALRTRAAILPGRPGCRGRPFGAAVRVPLRSLDLADQRIVTRLIDQRRRRANTPTLFVTHEINPVLPMPDRVHPSLPGPTDPGYAPPSRIRATSASTGRL